MQLPLYTFEEWSAESSEAVYRIGSAEVEGQMFSRFAASLSYFPLISTVWGGAAASLIFLTLFSEVQEAKHKSAT